MSSLSDHLWSESPAERLRAARAIEPQELQQVTDTLMEGCPFSAWPYGCSTSINPWVVFLGPSPGTSPRAGDTNFVVRKGSPPTAGSPPESMVYEDSRGFFERLRLLTREWISDEVGQPVSLQDALSLSGMMNFDSGASGEAGKVKVDPAFARWSLDVTIRRLRPRYFVGVGLLGLLKRHAWLRDLLTGYVGMPFNPKRPSKTAPFRRYREKHFIFKAWRLRNSGSARQYFILFPQHPSRAPMTRPTVWTDAVQECVAFAKAL